MNLRLELILSLLGLGLLIMLRQVVLFPLLVPGFAISAVVTFLPQSVAQHLFDLIGLERVPEVFMGFVIFSSAVFWLGIGLIIVFGWRRLRQSARSLT